ncbi:DUF6415 family natural product biosynthesis protein [Streptomyces sp. NPDC102274]|uniref:DUF6415 family natural product biosynthesis protein n=1 Tax=Streptomyces sp. NPDC102274 TaxID=3366151 RepID=UPI00382074A9
MATDIITPVQSPLGRRFSDDSETLERVLCGLQGLPMPVILEGIYESLEAVLGEFGDPSPPHVEQLTEQLGAALMRLVTAMLRMDQEQLGREAAVVTERARAVRVETLPVGFVAGRGLMRRRALAALDLLDLLMEEAGRPRPRRGGGQWAASGL